MKRKILCLGDIHAPFHSREAVTVIIDCVEQIRPDVIIQLGDSLDLYSFSNFPKKPLSRMTAIDEVTEGLLVIEELWGVLRKRCPKAKLIQILGNHCVRINKRLIEKFPEIYKLFDPVEIFSFEGVEVIRDYSEYVEIDGIAFHHGFKTKPGEHAKHFERSTVFGHTHRAWIQYEVINGKLCFDFSVGYLADPTNEALKYTETRIHKWHHGFGLIEDGVPRFIPIVVEKYRYKPKIF